MLLFLEPYGVTYGLQPGDECIVTSRPPDPDPAFGFELTDDGVTFCFEGHDAAVMAADGTVLDVGHQRPAGKFPGVPRPRSADPVSERRPPSPPPDGRLMAAPAYGRPMSLVWLHRLT
jgi:hypothetical protein